MLLEDQIGKQRSPIDFQSYPKYARNNHSFPKAYCQAKQANKQTNKQTNEQASKTINQQESHYEDQHFSSDLQRNLMLFQRSAKESYANAGISQACKIITNTTKMNFNTITPRL